jgi:hypothetical protein
MTVGKANEFHEICQALSQNSVVGPRASGFSPGKDGEVRQRRNIGRIVDGAPDVHRDSQAGNKPLEVRSSFQTEPIVDAMSFCVHQYLDRTRNFADNRSRLCVACYTGSD